MSATTAPDTARRDHPTSAMSPAVTSRRWLLLSSLFYGRSTRRTLALALLGAFAQHAGTIVAAAAGGWLVGAAAEGRHPGQLTAGFVVLGIAVVAAAVGTWANGLYGHAFAFRHQPTLRLGIYDGLERSAPRELLGARSGELAAITMGDVELLEGFFAHLGITATIAALTSLGTVAALGVLHPVFAPVAAAGLLLLAVAPTVLARRSQRLGEQLRSELGGLNAEVVDGIQGLRELIAFRQTASWTGRVRARTVAYQARQRAHGRATGLQAAVTDLVMSVTIVAILLLAISAGADHAISLPTATMAIPLTIAALAPVAEATGMASALAPLRAAARRVLAVIDQPAYVTDKGTSTTSTPADDSGTTIAFRDVSFSYQPDRPVLDHVSFEVAAGELVALAGATGAGKTSCANLLLRFWDPDAGTISIGGVDLRDLPLDTLHRLVAVVPQDIYLFAQTVADNLRLGAPDASDEQLVAAARAANAHEFIDRLPDGYQTRLVERGAQLSGGERQRLAIARAVLHDGPILLMDEATANLDTDNEQAIQLALRQARAGRTTLVIAHRLSTLATADRVVFLHGGCVAATGTHSELVANHPAYAAMLTAQLTDAS